MAATLVVGYDGSKGALLGSVPQKLVHLSDHPVLVVPVRDD